jgi:hypothetical protein
VVRQIAEAADEGLERISRLLTSLDFAIGADERTSRSSLGTAADDAAKGDKQGKNWQDKLKPFLASKTSHTEEQSEEWQRSQLVAPIWP